MSNIDQILKSDDLQGDQLRCTRTTSSLNVLVYFFIYLYFIYLFNMNCYTLYCTEFFVN